MSEAEKIEPFLCEGRGCKHRKTEDLWCLNGFGTHPTKDDKRWLCGECFEKVHEIRPMTYTSHKSAASSQEESE